MTKYFPPQFISDTANQASKPFIIPFGDNEQHVFKNLDQLNNTECWPTKEQLGLDKSQWEALVTTSKSQFSITHGLPGTGMPTEKTTRTSSSTSRNGDHRERSRSTTSRRRGKSTAILRFHHRRTA